MSYFFNLFKKEHYEFTDKIFTNPHIKIEFQSQNTQNTQNLSIMSITNYDKYINIIVSRESNFILLYIKTIMNPLYFHSNNQIIDNYIIDMDKTIGYKILNGDFL